MGNSSIRIALPIETETDGAAFWKLYDELYCTAAISDNDDCIRVLLC
jgi:hypothetical protein